jgi:hypothetical protein
VAPASPSVEESDTLPLVVRVLDRAGDSVTGAVVTLIVLDTAALRVDSAGVGVIGRVPATAARVVAFSGALRSDPLSIRVLAAADSIGATGVVALTVAAADSQSGPLATAVLDLTTTTGQAAPLSSRPVRYSIVFPVFVDLSSATAVLGNDSLDATVLTATGGTTSVVVKRRGAAQPDSAVVLASAVRGTGATVTGSPVRFVVRFQ